MTISLLLVLVSLVLALASAITGRVPLWIAVFVLALALLIDWWAR